MQNQRQKYLGMTCGQVILLACLGLVALGGIWFASRLILGIGLPAPATQVPISLPEPLTPVPLETDTSVPSSMPIQPTLTFTVTSYASLIPQGWTQYKYEKVELWMPADFAKKSSKDAVVYAENKNGQGNGFIVSVGLEKYTPVTTNLDDYIREGLTQFTPDTTFLEKKKFVVGSYEAQRLKLQTIITNISVGEAVYFIKDGGNIWMLAGICRYEDFHTWLTTFDQIAHTFRINP
jgi:hypothetical protein